MLESILLDVKLTNKTAYKLYTHVCGRKNSSYVEFQIELKDLSRNLKYICSSMAYRYKAIKI